MMQSVIIAAGIVLMAASSVSMVSVSPAADWPQFRGPNCSGVSTDTAPLPVKFSVDERVKWGVELGDGIGCPIVAGGRVFVSAMMDPMTVGLLAYDASTGALLWNRQWPVGDVDEIHLTNSHAYTTPASDGERVYFYFTTLGMIAVDARSGQDVWHQPLPVPYFVFKWGAGMSPVLYQDLVLFVQDDDLHPAMYAFDKVTGKLRWRDDRNDMAVNYSHPVICSTEHGDEIVVAGTGLLIGYDPKSGERLWYARTLLRNIKTTPVCHNGIIYVSVQSKGIASQWLASIDQWETGNRDNRISREEVQAFFGKRPVPEAFFEKTFGRGDLNGDGYLEGEELDIAFLAPNNRAGAAYDSENPADEYIVAVRGGGRGDVTDSHVLWRHPTKHTDHIVSPLVSGSRMLLIKEGGIATCFETDDGRPLYGPVRINNSGSYFASPVCGDGKIYMAGENGNIVVFADSPEMKILSINDMGSPVLGTPAIADGAIFVRTRQRLLRIE